MPEPETSPPRASPTRFEPTTPERVRQVELNRLRGTLVGPSSVFHCLTRIAIFHSQGKATRAGSLRRLVLLRGQRQQQETPLRRPCGLWLPNWPLEQYQRR